MQTHFILQTGCYVQSTSFSFETNPYFPIFILFFAHRWIPYRERPKHKSSSASTSEWKPPTSRPKQFPYMFVIVAEARSAERWHGTSSVKRCHATTHEIAYRGAMPPHAAEAKRGRRSRGRRQLQQEEEVGEDHNQSRRSLFDQSKAAKKAERKAWKANNKATAAATVVAAPSSVEATKHSDDYEYRGDSTDDSADPPKAEGQRSGLVCL